MGSASAASLPARWRARQCGKEEAVGEASGQEMVGQLQVNNRAFTSVITLVLQLELWFYSLHLHNSMVHLLSSRMTPGVTCCAPS